MKSANWVAADHADGRLMVWLMNEGDAVQHVSASTGADLMADLAWLVGTLHGCAPETPILLNDDSLRGGTTGTIAVPAKVTELPMGEAMLGTHPLRLLGGLSQSAPVGVMRGAVNRIAGFLSLNPDWDGVICIAGMTTHWALISAEEVVSFQGFLTPGLWRSLAPGLGIEGGAEFQSAERTALTAAMETIQSKPEALAARLAELQVLRDGSDSETSARLWGLLLGAELSAARPYWLGQNVALIAAAPLDVPYCLALNHQGVPVTRTDADRMALAGLVRAWRGITS
ncbi:MULTISPECIES: 2-dehydro-3-deoxygalactonokinase [unclassified Phaeobacter]|uniref:2-dehydro-3-deoxygalactonokinase n=1 Tax=unclassified Phaeobacter TaxID=2621772 RepID=UPI003A84A4A0